MTRRQRIGKVLWALGALELTVVLLALSIVLVFFGTLDQVRIGLMEAQARYFESFVAVWQYPPTWAGAEWLGWLRLPMPGGYIIGPLLTVNLVASHLRHFRLRWSFAGISFIHAGIVLLLVGQLLTNVLQEDHYMWLDEGERSNYAESHTEDELVLVERFADGRVGQYVMDFETLREGERLEVERMGLALEVVAVMADAEIQSQGAGVAGERYGVNRGIGAQFGLVARARARGGMSEQRAVRMAVVEVYHAGQSLGRWMLASVFVERFPPQTVEVGGRTIELAVRFQRQYMPFSLTLLDFTHERYPGTQIPRNFASKVRLEDGETGYEEELVIFMNNPLRYRGLTFFQASFAKQDTASMFHVVKNPGWRIPYIACLLVTIGLSMQFGFILLKMLRRKGQ